ncbi:MAG: hypothetical protein AAFX06_08185 [Planctomycetota bacterium]
MQALGKLAIVTLCGVFFAGSAPANDGTPGGVRRTADLPVLKKRKLKIPFTANAETSGRVRLYVSTDQGASWRVGAEQPPEGNELLFEGTEDGEHWFALSTADPVDPATLAAQQKVLIDSLGPKIQLQASADTQGTLSGTIQLSDLSDVKSLRVLYATNVHRQWRQVDHRAIKPDGKFQIAIREDWTNLSVHITAIDSLGHVSVEAKKIERPRIASIPPKTGFATHESHGSQPDLEAQFVDGPNHPGNLFLAQQTSTPKAPASTTPSQLPPGGLPAKITPDGIEVVPAPEPVEEITEYQELPAPKTDTNAPVTPPAAVELTPPANNGGMTPPAPSETDSAPQSRSRTLAEALRPMTETPNEPPSPDAPETIPTPTPSQTPQDRGRYQAEKAETESRLQQNKYDLAKQLRDLPIRYSNSNRFSLDYELEAVAATGVEAVELYGSLDGGKTWKRWGSDPDARSPFDIETKGEGVFSFRVVVLGNNGLASPRPLDGDDPDIVIVVDQTEPRIKITSARYGEGDRTGSLEIRYSCEDENLTNRPVAIAFSESLQGPWSTIVSGLRNDGLYVWPADPKIPRRIYLRVDATDQAGNRGKYLLDQPIETQGLAPRAKILGLRTR